MRTRLACHDIVILQQFILIWWMDCPKNNDLKNAENDARA